MEPDARGPRRFLWFVLRQRPGVLIAATISGALWMLPTALMPLAVGRAIDIGIGAAGTNIQGSTTSGGALLRWVLVVLLLGVVQCGASAVLIWAAHTLWTHGTAATQRIALRHVTVLGRTLSRNVRTGEVVAIGASDASHVGDLFEVLGRAAGSVVSFLVAAAIVLVVAPIMGLVVLIGVPLATAGIVPLLGPFFRRQAVQRERFGDLSALAADIVSGLRILRGIGGESRFHSRFVASSQQVRRAGVEVGKVESWLAGAEILLPGLVTVLVTWLGARLALAGTISVGELVAFYGVSAFLVIPVRTATEAAGAYSSALVAATRACALLRMRPVPAPVSSQSLPSGPLDVVDESSGVRARAGAMTVIDAGVGAEALAERLSGPAGSVVRAGGIRLGDADPAEVRGRIVLLHHEDVLFAGPVDTELDLGKGVNVEEALHAADALDVLDVLPADRMLDERARSLSGGQRQRLLLARALCSDVDVLVMHEPTSAVDAHTEERIVRRVREFRRGRTTIVLSQSPLWMNSADEVRAVEGQRA